MNNSLLERLDTVWSKQPNKAMLVCDKAGLDYHTFKRELEFCVDQLAQYNPTGVAVLADNSAHWVVTDIACQHLCVPMLPLPLFFTPLQMQHAIKDAGCDLLLVESAMTQTVLERATGCEVIGQLYDYCVVRMPLISQSQLPENTGKITFTSGSTGNPKGVCLSNEHQWTVAQSIQSSINKKTARHLCILPLSTLLENIAGVYAALLNGATVILPSLATLGFSGSSSLNFTSLLEQITQLQPSSLITTPELLSGLVNAAEQGWQVPYSLDFVAVGGARVAPGLLERAYRVSIAAYQGYGLSECGSVVSLNVPHCNDINAMGTILPHAQVTIEDGEVMVQGQLFLGYTNQPKSWSQQKVATGDLGYLDEKGQLVVTGRKKNVLISSYGRNINPEWVEAEVLVSPLIKQAYLFGDDKPYCVAAIVPVHPQVEVVQINDWIKQVNQLLPDYAQVKQWFIPQKDISISTGLLTNNGRPKRPLLEALLASEINERYALETALQEATL